MIARHATCPVNQRAPLRSVGQKRKTILRSIVKEDWQFRSELTRPSAGQVLQRLRCNASALTKLPLIRAPSPAESHENRESIAALHPAQIEHPIAQPPKFKFNLIE